MACFCLTSLQQGLKEVRVEQTTGNPPSIIRTQVVLYTYFSPIPPTDHPHITPYFPYTHAPIQPITRSPDHPLLSSYPSQFALSYQLQAFFIAWGSSSSSLHNLYTIPFTDSIVLTSLSSGHIWMEVWTNMSHPSGSPKPSGWMNVSDVAFLIDTWCHNVENNEESWQKGKTTSTDWLTGSRVEEKLDVNVNEKRQNNWYCHLCAFTHLHMMLCGWKQWWKREKQR